MKRIFVSTPYSSDANSFWRCMGPLSYLAKHSEGEIEIHLPPDGQKIHWDRLDQFDLIFLHRPCRPQDLTLLQMARLMNIPTWSEYDDWLFHIPPWNPHRNSYHQTAIQTIMATVIACSDIVSVTTSALEKMYSKINPRVVILPNAYRSDLFPYAKKMEERDECYLWRGTNTHEGDVLPMATAFQSFSKKVKFFGAPPYSLTSLMDADKYEVHDFVDPMMYWRRACELKPKVWLCPLADDYFNLCKSNISWIEAIHAGAICVAPDMPEWKQPGCITYERDNAKAFFDAAEYAIHLSPSELRNHVKAGRDQIAEKYDIKVINELRLKVFNTLFHPSFERNPRDPFSQLTGLWALGQLKNEPEQNLPGAL